MKLASNAQKAVSSNVGNVLRTDEIPNHKLTGRVTAAVKKSLRESSYQPMVKAYKDVVKDVQTLPEKAVRIWNAWDPERVQEKPVEGGLDCRQGSREIDHDGDGSGHPGSGDGGLSDGHGGRRACRFCDAAIQSCLRRGERRPECAPHRDHRVRGGPGWGGCAPVRQ
ncbi:hypothetical protein G6F59_016241 [Rhizopus arrhizus]|nr:hypothetical protein G6F59_016241 [Rhizopus arrhizus]